MGSIADKLRHTLAGKSDIIAAIEEKGINVGAAVFSEYGNKIRQISGLAASYRTRSEWEFVVAGTTAYANHFRVEKSFGVGAPLLTIDWGDGCRDTVNITGATTFAHAYPSVGNYTISVIEAEISNITSVISAFYFGPSQSSVSFKTVVQLNKFQSDGLTSLSYLLYGTTVFTGFADGFTFETSNVINLSNSFASSRITSIPGNLFAGLSSVTNLSGVFGSCTRLESVPDNLFAGLNAVTTFAYAFNGCTSLRTVGNNVFAGCTAAIDFIGLFSGCSSLETIGVNLFKDCASVTTGFSASASSTSAMFYNTLKLVSVGAGMFDGCTKVTNLSWLFFRSGIISIPDNLFFGLSSVTNLSGVFGSCTRLESVPDNLFTGLSSVTNFSTAFNGCTNLESIPDNLFTGLNTVTTFASAFTNCTSLRTVGNNVFAECNAVTTIQGIFQGCTLLSEVPVMPAGNITATTNAFNGCSALADFGGLQGIKVVFSLADSSLLTSESLENIIAGLADLTGTTSRTCTLHATTKALLTTEQNQSVIAKNWKIT
jgi:hypothetical protein